MSKYEVTVILSAKLDDTKRAEAIDRIKGYIARYGGTVDGVDEWGKRRLSYEIKREQEGFYYLVNFEGNSDTPNLLEGELRIYEPVIRYLVVKNTSK